MLEVFDNFSHSFRIIDGGSKDGSIQKARKNGWKVFIQNKRNKGVLNGIKY